MPYLTEADKRKVEDVVTRIQMANIDTPGKLNYLITCLVLRVIRSSEVNYTLYNGIIGALECAKQELYRRQIAPYEKLKAKLNGDLYKGGW